jgi:RNA polymerase sigma factor (sigma-70 family)
MVGRSEPGSSARAEPDRTDLTRLVAAASSGDQQAWNEIVDRFSRLLWSICRAHGLGTADAADVFQMTWLRLLEHLHTIQQPERLPAWLATTCRRECLAYLRRTRRTQPTSDERLLDLFADNPVPSADRPAIVSSRDTVLWALFGRLSERCQQVLRVLVVTAEDGPPQYDLVATALGMPTGSLGPTRQRCLAQLRKLLAAEGINGSAFDS